MTDPLPLDRDALLDLVSTNAGAETLIQLVDAIALIEDAVEQEQKAADILAGLGCSAGEAGVLIDRIRGALRRRITCRA